MSSMGERNSTVLVVDDDDQILTGTARTLELGGYRVLTAKEAVNGSRLLETERVDAVLLDLRLPGINGFEALEAMRAAHPHLAVIMMTAYGEVPEAVKATKLGAYDFLKKPVERDSLLVAVRNACERTLLGEERNHLLSIIGESYRMVGNSGAIEKLRRDIAHVAKTNEPVLIFGETGTGKELVARSIWLQSLRSARPYVAVNCAAITASLAESELFGHKRGSFTGANEDKLGRFAVANGGTILLDEIGDMESALQAKVLRALQEGEIEMVGATHPIKVDVRVIAATNQDLDEMVRARSFRADLLYRLKGVVIKVPPLRERLDDVRPLLQLFLMRRAEQLNKAAPMPEPAAMEILMRHDWPGNVRELDLCAGFLMTYAGPEITVRDVREWLGQTHQQNHEVLEARSYVAAKINFEQTYFKTLLAAHEGNISAVSRAAGLDRAGVHRKLKALGIVDNSP
jgi:DNA-binding NtrC family response regulator